MSSSSAATKPGVLNWIILMFLGLIWGASFMGVKLSLTGFGPYTVAAGRITLAALVLLTIAFASGVGLPTASTATGRRIWLHCIGMGFFTNALPFSLLSWGQLHVTSGFAGITMAVVPLLVLPLAHFFVPGERLSLVKVIGFLMGFVGVVILIGPATIFGGDADSLARLACVAASLCYACGAIITRLTPKTPLLSFSAGGLLVATAMILPMALWREGLPSAPPLQAIGGVIYLGLFPTALATLLLVRVINSAGPSFLSLVNYQVPLWAVAIGSVLFAEPLPSQFTGALGLILLGLAVSQVKRRKRAGVAKV